MSKVTFNNKNCIFFTALKKEVEQYFQQKNLKKSGNWKLFIKSSILIPAAAGIYLSLLLFSIPTFIGIVLCLVLGFILASIGFNIMHDACHGSFSSRKWVNETLGYTLNALGGNSFIWKFKHNIIHHTYPNVDGIDDDIAKSPLMRQCTSQKWMPAHRFQHIYVVLVYAISTFAWVFLMDFTKYFKKKVFSTPMQKMNTRDHFIFWISKVLYLLFYIAIPVYMVGWQSWAIGFTVMHITMGLTLALVFQLAHVVEHAEFVALSEMDTKVIENEWAIHQIKTTVNFAPKNKIISWFVGGLNFQIEHHLFPKVSHVHYPAISKIVQKICDQFNIPYHEYPTMMKAISSHFRMMKQLGQKPAFSRIVN